MKYFQIILLTLVVVFLGCGKSQSPSSASKTQPGAAVPHEPQVDPATVGSVSGVVSFKGAAPKLRSLDMTQDPACPADPQPSDAVVVRNGKLANVFVYLKDGKGLESSREAATPVVVDQKRCRYQPHVLGLLAGQPLKILNDDNALHNVHPMPKANDEWNESQMPRGKPIEKSFSHPELMMPVQCNQHPWMRMYVNVMEHPFFGVTGDDGSFEIKNLAPGEYTLVAIHEKFGEQTSKVTVPAKGNAKVDFVFSAESK
jgi:plastocyanin